MKDAAKRIAEAAVGVIIAKIIEKVADRIDQRLRKPEEPA